MIITTKSMTFAHSVARRGDRDLSWYGTLGVLAACLGVLATLFFSGCSGSAGAHAVNPPAPARRSRPPWSSGRKGRIPGRSHRPRRR